MENMLFILIMESCFIGTVFLSEGVHVIKRWIRWNVHEYENVMVMGNFELVPYLKENSILL